VFRDKKRIAAASESKRRGSGKDPEWHGRKTLWRGIQKKYDGETQQTFEY